MPENKVDSKQNHALMMHLYCDRICDRIQHSSFVGHENSIGTYAILLQHKWWILYFVDKRMLALQIFPAFLAIAPQFNWYKFVRDDVEKIQVVGTHEASQNTDWLIVQAPLHSLYVLLIEKHWNYVHMYVYTCTCSLHNIHVPHGWLSVIRWTLILALITCVRTNLRFTRWDANMKSLNQF